MFNVILKFDKAEDAAYVAKYAEEAAFKGTLSNLASAILRDSLKHCKGVTVMVIRNEGDTGTNMTADELRAARNKG